MISFNLRRLDGLWFGYREVEKLASLSGIQLRVLQIFIYKNNKMIVYPENFFSEYIRKFKGYV